MNVNKEWFGQEYTSSIHYASMLSELTRPAAFPFSLPGDALIRVIQTHASAVVLTPDYVYKLKKPKNFGFFDYSTPALRRHFCGQEVRLNTRLAPNVYLGVAPVLAFSDDRFCFGPTFPPDEVPEPGTQLNGGRVVDYAVVMVCLPDEATLEYRVDTGTADPPLLKEIAQHVAAFHTTSCTDEHIASFGSLEVIRGNWEENFEQMRPYISRTLDAVTYEQIVNYIRGFMQERYSLFASRIREGHIRDCHGDLRLQHVYILDRPDDTGAAQKLPRLAMLDGIEFNERFRYSDVTSEVAFLTMELDAACRSDLSRAFIDSYVTETGDEALRELLPFYSCYRAYIRGKVLSFLTDEAEVPVNQRESARREAASLFALASSYANGPTQPTLVLIGGLMGTGKSTLALALQHELGWALFSSDTMRKRLAHLDPAQPQADAFGQGWYNRQWSARTYHALLNEASTALAHGRSVLLDATYTRRADRQAAAREAAALGANLIFIECACPREVALERLAQRWKARTEGSESRTAQASRASDARPELYDAQCASWEAYNAGEEPGMRHLVVTTTTSLAQSRAKVLDALGMTRLACWL